MGTEIMGKGGKKGHGNPLHHGDTLFAPFNDLFLLFACPGQICSCVGKRCCQCADSIECCCCLEEGLCKFMWPKTCCKATQQCCCLDMHSGFPCDSEMPCGCGACNCHWCGKEPTKVEARLGPSMVDDACFCCRCPGCQWGLYCKCPACFGCSLMGLCCCCDQEWTCQFVCPKTLCKAMRQCCCCDLRCTICCDDQIPCVCALCNCVCCGKKKTEETITVSAEPVEGKA